MTLNELTRGIDRAIGNRSQIRIANMNLHGAYMYHTDARFKEYCDTSDLVVIDGWPVLVLTRLVNRGVTSAHRYGSSDWVARLLSRSVPVRICALGASPSASLGAKAVVDSQFPHVVWHAIHGFQDWENATNVTSVINDINAFRPDVLLVGMGMPKQEHWLLEAAASLDAPVLANVGGCIDYIAREQALAPRWLGKVGLEWAYRLVRDPRRLGRRYLAEPWKLLWLLATRSLKGNIRTTLKAVKRSEGRRPR